MRKIVNKRIIEMIDLDMTLELVYLFMECFADYICKLAEDSIETCEHTRTKTLNKEEVN